MELTDHDRRLLGGAEGDAARLAMELVVRMAEILEAGALIDITSAHVDGCLYHGQAGLDFAERLAAGGGRVRVPTTLNVGSIDRLHPELFRGDPKLAVKGRRLMDAYVEMGCEPTWTCAPYQLESRPGRGEQIAWAESNAIVFANSVLGARTDRYGDFIDICAALTGRVPDAGLHREENRRGEIVFDLRGLPSRLLRTDVCYPVVGHLVGREAGSRVPVLVGLPPDVEEDRLRALGAAAASSGAVAFFHAVGVTPEAPSLAAALGGQRPHRVVEVGTGRLCAARDSLTTAEAGPLQAVSLGTPHFSLAEFARLVPLLDDTTVHPDVELYVSTGRHVLEQVEARGWREILEGAGARLVVDTCTYVTPILREHRGTVMTSSAKWAYYAPGNLGVEVAFGSLEECVESAVRGRVWRDERLWRDADG